MESKTALLARTCVGVLTIGLWSAVPAPLNARQLTWLPDGGVAQPLIEPREPHMAVKMVGIETGSSRFGSGVEWEAIFGHMIPLVRFQGDDPRHAVTLGVQAGVFGRFAFETKKRDLITSDWIFGAPIFITNGDHWIRIRYRHNSAHLGDDYIDRFSVVTEGYLRDDLGVVAYRQVSPTVGLYGGGDVAFNVDPDVNKRIALNGGIEFNTRQLTQGRWYGGIDLHVDQDVSWKPRINIHVGTVMAEGEHTAVRLTLEILNGPSPQREFRKRTERYLAVGLAVDIK